MATQHAGHKAQAANRKPGPAKVTDALAQAAQVLAAAAKITDAPAAPALPKTVTVAPVIPAREGFACDVELNKLPKSIAVRGTNTSVVPPAEADHMLYYGGKPFTARSPHNAMWAERAIKAVGSTGATYTAVAKAGVPVYSIKAYLKRGWLTKTKPAVKEEVKA